MRDETYKQKEEKILNVKCNRFGPDTWTPIGVHSKTSNTFRAGCKIIIQNRSNRKIAFRYTRHMVAYVTVDLRIYPVAVKRQRR